MATYKEWTKKGSLEKVLEWNLKEEENEDLEIRGCRKFQLE